MTDDECRRAFDDLQKILSGAGLSWAVAQVAEEIRFGRTSRKSVRVRSEPPDEVAVFGLGGRGRTSRVTVSATQPYSPRDQLGLLLDALERAVVDVFDMKETTKAALIKRGPKWTSLKLVRTDDDQTMPVSIDRSEDSQRADSVTSLRLAIRGLRGEI